MANPDPHTSGTEVAAQGAPVWDTLGRVLFILVAGTGLFYLLGKLTDRVRGIEREAARQAKRVEELGNVPPHGRPAAIPDLPRLAAYPNAESYSGGEVFLLNGSPRRIATFETKDRPDVVTAWYARTWREVGLTPNAVGNEQSSHATAIDLRLNLRHTVMAQWVPESRMTVANVSISTVIPIDTGFKQTHLPLPEGTVPMMDMRSQDAGAPGAMVAYLVPLPPGEARTHMIRRLVEQGWTYEENYSRAPDERGWSVLFFSHGSRLLTLTFDSAGNGGTSMIVNESMDLE